MLRQVAALSLIVLGSSCAGGPASSPPLEVRLPPAPSFVETTRPAPAASASSPSSAPAPIVWETSELDARERAKKRGLPLVIFACAAWSAACHAMERDVFTDPRVARLGPRFVWLKIDLTETEGEAELVAQRLGISGVPMTMVVDPDGSRVYAEPQFVAPDRLAKDLALVADRGTP